MRPFQANLKSLTLSYASKKRHSSSQGKAMARTIKLTDQEALLRQLLLDVSSYIGTLGEYTEPELRFTGGWVRDKILGSTSNDIDISISSMTGYRFGTLMKGYLARAESRAKYDEGIVGSLAKIEANPEKSKHLETITTKILGLDIDLVNLRKETYAENSRNPSMEFGTPEDDALRRDATVNALFYNLSTSSVEDYTGRGLQDMESKVIKTPLAPLQTFKDDPLRVLRSIRFAGRLGYRIAQEDEQAMSDETIKEALKVKITRERVGVEITKILKGPDPHMALCLIDRLGLYNTIFTNPKIQRFELADTERWNVAYDQLLAINRAPSKAEDESSSLASIRQILLPDPKHVYVAWLLCAFVPWAKAGPVPPEKSKAKPPPTVAATVAREGVDLNKITIKAIDNAVLSLPDIRDIREAIKEREGTTALTRKRKRDSVLREVQGMAVRRWGVHWRSNVIYALLVEITEIEAVHDRQILVDGYATWISTIKELGLLDAPSLKPIVNGKQLCDAFGAKNGPWLKKALDFVIEWQLRNPDETDAGAAIEEVKRRKKETGLV